MFSTPCSYIKRSPGTETDHNHDCELEKLCICQVVTPVIRFCQFFGVFPVSFHDSTGRKISEDGLGQLFRFDDTGLVAKLTKRFLGKLPATVQRKSKECHVSSRWFTIPSMTNFLLMVVLAGVTSWAFSQMHVILRVYFEGTDLYTFGTQTICLYIQANLTLMNAFLNRKRFCEIWSLMLKILKKLTQKPNNKINETEEKQNGLEDSIRFYVPSRNGNLATDALHNFVIASAMLQNLEYNCPTSKSPDRVQSSSPHRHLQLMEDSEKVAEKGENLRRRFKKLHIFSYITVATIVITSTSHIVSFFYLVFHACFDKTADPGNGFVLGKPPCPLNNVLLLLQKCAYGMIDFVKQGVAVLFGTLCLTIYLFYRELEEQLESILRGSRENNKSDVSVQRHLFVEHLRVCYEDLSQLCRLMSQCFGLAIISVLITSIISITCALYSFALYSGVIERDSSMNLARFYVIWAFHGWIGCFCLFLVLIPGQLITNASEAPSQVIGRHSLSHFDNETKYQLSQFQHQARQPVVLSACNVANVGLGFISSAATNVTTYILVILQFRLGVESKS